MDAITTAVHDTTNKPSVISITGRPGIDLDASVNGGSRCGLPVCRSAGCHHYRCSRRQRVNRRIDRQQCRFSCVEPARSGMRRTKLDANGATIVSEWCGTSWPQGWRYRRRREQRVCPSQLAGERRRSQTKRYDRRAWRAGRGRRCRPNTGYTIRVDGDTSVIGGTSAVAPLWAGLVAVANQQLGTQVGSSSRLSTRRRLPRRSTTLPRATMAPSRRPGGTPAPGLVRRSPAN